MLVGDWSRNLFYIVLHAVRYTTIYRSLVLLPHNLLMTVVFCLTLVVVC